MVIDRAAAIIILGCVLLSCGNSGHGQEGDSGEDQGERADDGGVEDSRGEDPRDEDAFDGLDRDETSVEDIVDSETPDGCSVPILDCGPGCRQVTCMGTVIWQYAYDFYANYLAYFSRRELYLKDLESGEEKLLYRYSYPVHGHFLTMYGNRIVFQKWPVSEGGSYIPISLILYNIASSSVEEIYRTPGNLDITYVTTLKYLDMYEDRLVTVTGDTSWRADDNEIFMFLFDPLDMIQLTETPYHQGAVLPRIWGSTVVFTYNWRYPSQIMVIDPASLETSPLSEAPKDQLEADLWGSRVVWTDHRNDSVGYNTDIYWCDLPECVARPATTDPATQDSPSVEGDWIVWADYRNSVCEIWGYNVSTDTEVQVESFNQNLFAPRVHNGRAYFIAAPTGDVSDGDAIFEVVLPVP